MARIAVVGAGISGLACADLLAPHHDVVLYEKENRPGGHSRTLTLPLGDSLVTVDTGFIVYNEVNYPLLTKLFSNLGVTTQPSDMSFGVRYGEGELEFCASSLGGLFAQKKNLLSPRYFKMLTDILRFFRSAHRLLLKEHDPTLEEFLIQLGTGDWFRDRFLIPMGAAIWSSPPADMFAFPAKNFIQFFENHGLLSIRGHHKWRTVLGGSQEYVRRLAGRLGSRLKLGTPVARVCTSERGHTIISERGHPELFDHVVLASHADETQKILVDLSHEERQLLSAFAFRNNQAILHTDEKLMPRNRKAWASWVYAAGGVPTNHQVSVTYWMNRLQNLKGQNLFVSLNPDQIIEKAKILDRYVFRHPVFTKEAIRAQRGISSLQGRKGLWFCGAWLYNGFHEDGLRSAVEVAQKMKVPIRWL